jgi:hypothetical protein
MEINHRYRHDSNFFGIVPVPPREGPETHFSDPTRRAGES